MKYSKLSLYNKKYLLYMPSNQSQTMSDTKQAVQSLKLARGLKNSDLESKGIVVCTIYVAKTNSLISCEITVQLICTFVFVCSNSRFSHVAAHMSHVMRKPTFYICEKKDTDQLRGDRKADQRLCFCYIDSTIPLLS